MFLLNPSWSKRLKRDYREEHLGLINHDVTQNMAGYELTTSFSPVPFILYLCIYICILIQQVHNHKEAIMFWFAFAECEERAGTLVPHLWGCWLLTWTLMTIKRGEKRSPTSSNVSFIWNWERHFSFSLSKYFLKEPVYFYIYNDQQACNKLVKSRVRLM